MRKIYADASVSARTKQIISLVEKGTPVRELALRFHVSHQRIYQLLKRKRNPRRYIYLDRRATCYICRKRLLPTDTKYCQTCIKDNKLDTSGRDVSRGLVRGRDNNTCQACGIKWNRTAKKRLDVHHLSGLCGAKTKSYDRLSELHKLITLCHKCHFGMHDHAQNGVRH